MVTEDQKRQDIIEQGSRAYRFGIERHNSPLKDISARNLWVNGWDQSKKSFEVMFPPRRVTQ